MAASSGKKKSNSRKSSGTRSTKTSSRQTAASRQQNQAMYHEIGLIVLFVVLLFLFCCNFGIVGPLGNAISGFLFGLFGLTAYIAPILIFLATAFWLANEGNSDALRKLIAGIVLFLMVGILCELFTDNVIAMNKYSMKEIYTFCKEGKKGGGILSGSLAYLLHHYLETIGTVLVVLLCSVISIILMTEKSLLEGMRDGGNYLREIGREDKERRIQNNQLRRMEQDEIREKRRMEQEENRERRRIEMEENRERRRMEQEELRAKREEERIRREEERRALEEERRLQEEEKENEKILRMEKKVSGVMVDTSLKQSDSAGKKSNVHEIVLTEEEFDEDRFSREDVAFNYSNARVKTVHQVQLEEVVEEPPYEEEVADFEEFEEEMPEVEEIPVAPVMNIHSIQAPVEPMSPKQDMSDPLTDHIRIHKEDVEEPAEETAGETVEETKVRPVAKLSETPKNQTESLVNQKINNEVKAAERELPKEYIRPSLDLLMKNTTKKGDNTAELKETALRLEQTLNTFGVKVTITDISQGPSVTRYELQPEPGVKVSKIVGLSDDIKLNLAATDIRIEAPIPGKSAIGIEVPNKENMMVSLRELLEREEFQNFNSNLAFAVGKDIAGKTIVTDIAKMPHMLIAGSTGSGKSVCINTLIMSVLYKAHPDEVKLIMVDPKVVELSVYNGIPHLLIPVVTDPKKASAALHWAVSEMEDRYRRFADFNVRDLKGYNAKMVSLRESGENENAKTLPQIVIIVDELADLMMVCPGEVEESICRLAQLARACGIHLIIATQRPSVDVITGLIKANMPSRVAFAVSSGVDSRTILDMNGAEKLLGKGDMLFYPQGYSKPARIQGAFVSDNEVGAVVDYLKNLRLGNVYANDVEAQIQSIGSGSSSGQGGAAGGGDDKDEYFAEAGRFIIDKDKASIGMLQRVLKIGFNRAARIMDQLCEYGVVGEEEGTKPRKVLMSMEQFEQLLEEI